MDTSFTGRAGEESSSTFANFSGVDDHDNVVVEGGEDGAVADMAKL